MTVASGTRRGSADSTPSTSVQMWISEASSSAPKIEAEKSLPLRPSVVRTPRRSEAMKPVMMSVPVEVRRHLRRTGWRATRPTGSPGPRRPSPPAPRGSHRPTAPDPAAVTLLEEALEQPRGPDLAVAGDEVADGVGGRARQLDRVQDPEQVLAVAVEAGEVGLGGLRRQQLLGDGRMPRAQLRQFAAVAAVLALGERHQAQQRVRHALAGGQDHGQTGGRRGLEDGRDLAEAVGVSDARPPELVHDPGIGFAHRQRDLRP